MSRKPLPDREDFVRRGDFLRQLSELEEARVRVPGVPFDQGRHPQGKFSGNFPVTIGVPECL